MAPVILPLREMAAEAPLPLRVSGACMEPALASGARVVLKPAVFYWPGDIVAFSRNGSLVVHRVLGYRRGFALLTQADASTEPDGAVPRSLVLGRLVRRTPIRERFRAWGRFTRFAWKRLRARLP